MTQGAGTRALSSKLEEMASHVQCFVVVYLITSPGSKYRKL